MEMVRDGSVRSRLAPHSKEMFYLLGSADVMCFEFGEDGKVTGWSKPWTRAIKIE
jgi:hypothetical protein